MNAERGDPGERADDGEPAPDERDGPQSGGGGGPRSGRDGYVHTPADADAVTGATEPEAAGFGRAGWVLAVALAMCLLVVPGTIYAYPYWLGAFELPFFATYLVLPLFPAVLLGLVAVWSMTAATHGDAR